MRKAGFVFYGISFELICLEKWLWGWRDVYWRNESLEGNQQYLKMFGQRQMEALSCFKQGVFDSKWDPQQILMFFPNQIWGLDPTNGATVGFIDPRPSRQTDRWLKRWIHYYLFNWVGIASRNTVAGGPWSLGDITLKNGQFSWSFFHWLALL